MSLEIRGMQVKSTMTYIHATRTAVMQVWQFQVLQRIWMVAASKECWRKWGLEQPLWRKNQQYTRGFPGGSEGKEYACSAGNLGLIPGLGRSPGEGQGCPLQDSGLEKSMNCIVHGAAKRQTWLSDLHSHSPDTGEIWSPQRLGKLLKAAQHTS